MYRLTKEFTFEASHVLPAHKGKCSRLHGHSWKAAVTMEGNTTHTDGSSKGMLVDYGTLKEFVEPIVNTFLDHHHLNETTGLADPTSEALAVWLFNIIYASLPSELQPLLAEVRINETCTTACAYRRDR